MYFTQHQITPPTPLLRGEFIPAPHQRPRMPPRPRLVPTLLAAFVAGVAAAPSTARAQAAVHANVPSPSPDSAAVVAAVRALFAATERNDVAALDTLYAGDRLTVIEGAGIDRTWTGYRDHHLVPELREMRNLRYRASEIEAHVAGDVAWAVFRYGLSAKVDGRAADVVGRGTAVLERRGKGGGARWVVRHTHTSGRARRPGDPPLDA